MFENLPSNQISQYYVPTVLPGYRYFCGRAYTFQKKRTFWGTFFKKGYNPVFGVVIKCRILIHPDATDLMVGLAFHLTVPFLPPPPSGLDCYKVGGGGAHWPQDDDSQRMPPLCRWRWRLGLPGACCDIALTNNASTIIWCKLPSSNWYKTLTRSWTILLKMLSSERAVFTEFGIRDIFFLVLGTLCSTFENRSFWF